MVSVPISVLDLAIVAGGSTSASALADTTRLAARADELGFVRFWVAEHHNSASVASTQPAVLIAHLAANTRRIRVGSGGVMLPNHAPLVVAEQFAMLEALYPGRIDLGIGRAPGTDGYTAAALRRHSDGSEDELFPRHLLDVMGLLGDVRTDTGLHQRLVATPVPSSSPLIALLGSSGFSAQLAGMLGLPFAFAHHFGMGGTAEACEIYLRHFSASPVLDEPHLIVSAVAVAAGSRAEADHLLSSHRLFKHGLRTGRLFGVLPPDRARVHPAFEEAVAAGTNAVFGTGAEVADGLEELAVRFGASELMVTIPVVDPDARIEGLELVAAGRG